MFSVRRRNNDGQLWGHCDSCARFVNGEGCSHCTQAEHVDRAREAIERYLVGNGKVDRRYVPPSDDVLEVARAPP
eukprot:3242054-Lingulodinium_polyedra.AAC.1